MAEKSDPFASITKSCKITPTQEAKLRNCPFAGEPKASPEQAGISMVSPPESDSDEREPIAALIRPQKSRPGSEFDNLGFQKPERSDLARPGSESDELGFQKLERLNLGNGNGSGSKRIGDSKEIKNQHVEVIDLDSEEEDAEKEKMCESCRKRLLKKKKKKSVKSIEEIEKFAYAKTGTENEHLRKNRLVGMCSNGGDSNVERESENAVRKRKLPLSMTGGDCRNEENERGRGVVRRQESEGKKNVREEEAENEENERGRSVVRGVDSEGKKNVREEAENEESERGRRVVRGVDSEGKKNVREEEAENEENERGRGVVRRLESEGKKSGTEKGEEDAIKLSYMEMMNMCVEALIGKQSDGTEDVGAPKTTKKERCWEYPRPRWWPPEGYPY